MNKQIVISSMKLKELIVEMFLKVGVSQKHAEIIADSIIQAELRGTASHGVCRIPIYIKRIRKGLVNPNPHIRVMNETLNTAVLDGDFGLGQIIATEAMKMAINKAKEANIGVVGVRKSHHFGIASYYAMMALEEDMIGFVCSNTTPLMPAPGGAKRIIGNNPFSVAIPSGKHFPLVLDMACSTVAIGKIITAMNMGEAIPEGWALDANGVSTTDPIEAMKGLILPVGGHKGYGLAVIIDVLAGVLTGADFGINVKSIYSDYKQDSGHLMMALKIDSFIKINGFKERVDALINDIKESDLAPGVEEVFLPGEIEFRNRLKNEINGLSIPVEVYNQLLEIADLLNINKISKAYI